MTRLRQAQIGVTILLGIGLVIHALRFGLGVDFVQQYLLTQTFDAAFSVVMLVIFIVLVRARGRIALRSTGDRLVVWGTMIYVGLSVILHGRSWIEPDNVDVFGAFPWWYSLLFIAVVLVVLTLWWRLEPKLEEESR